MKRLLLILALFGMMAVGAFSPVVAQAQEEDLFEMEDTLSIDDMDPVFYEAEEETSGSNTTAIVGIAAVIVLGAGVYFVIKKKKK
ncbi:LPXTG cell wall anchor domain-containing protein [Sunxiuqinia sp. sy24]|uniref:LPXTG cell wall anchor domain-containing protein n=1 Tax=Sunxiuqinia sp. sy24 TaxID=3461495 RepID=UPI0040466136